MISFNELIMAALSISTSKVCEKHAEKYKSLKQVMTFIPIGTKGVPETPDEIEINNTSNAAYNEMTLIKDLSQGKRKIQEDFSKLIKHPALSSTLMNVTKLLLEFFPLELVHKLQDKFYSNIDLQFTNVPGPKETLYWDGCKVTDIIPLVSTSRTKTAVVVISYIDKFKFYVVCDQNSKINRDVFVNLMEQTLDEIADKYTS